MNTFKIIPLIIFFLSCGSDKISKPDEYFPIEEVLKNSSDTFDEIHLGGEDLLKLKAMDTAFFKKWFHDIRIPELKNEKLTYDGFSQWFFKNYQRQDNKIIFSILSNDGVAFVNLYYIVYDTTTKKLDSGHYLTQSGGDGGYYIDELVQWENKSLIKVYTTEYNETDISNSKTLSQRDSFITIFNFDDKILTGKEVFRSTKLDTINDK